jgi:hypothetical protein
MLHRYDTKSYTRTPDNEFRLTEISVPTLHKHFGKTFYKLSDESDGRFGVQYAEGLNVDPKPFIPAGNAQGGGLYFFTDVQLIFLKYNWFIPFKVKYIRSVTFDGEASDARIWVEDRKFKANKCNYGPRTEYSNRATDYVNWNSYDSCIRAVSEDTYPCVLKFVPKEIIDYELCKLTMQKHPRSYKYIPEEYQTDEINRLAIISDPSQIRFCINPDSELCKLAVSKDPKVAKYLKRS